MKPTSTRARSKAALWKDSADRHDVHAQADAGAAWARARVLAWGLLRASDRLGVESTDNDRRWEHAVNLMWPIYQRVQNTMRDDLIGVIARAASDQTFAAEARSGLDFVLHPTLRPLPTRSVAMGRNRKKEDRELAEAFDEAVTQWPRRGGPKAKKGLDKAEAIARFLGLWMRTDVKASTLAKIVRQPRRLTK